MDNYWRNEADYWKERAEIRADEADGFELELEKVKKRRRDVFTALSIAQRELQHANAQLQAVREWQEDFRPQFGPLALRVLNNILEA